MGQIYLAPLESITGHVFRQAYHRHINPNIDKYFSPFISPNQNSCFTSRERRDVLPENNEGIYLVPQILTKDKVRFVDTVKELKAYGYQEVNLNLGCPSPTVTTKKKGSGMLGDLEQLKDFLDYIFDKSQVDISVKTRIGIEDEAEWEPLYELFQQYPMKELIIHARLQQDFYGGCARMEAFNRVKENTNFPLCYNGDIFTQEDYNKVHCDRVMLGRGILRHPALSLELMGKEDTSDFWGFHDALVEGYTKEMSGDYPVIQKMKELWTHMITQFPDTKKELKAIKKAKHRQEYEAAVNALRY